MRLSTLVAKCEDTVIAKTPIVKAKAQQATYKTRNGLAYVLAKAAMKLATKDMVKQG